MMRIAKVKILLYIQEEVGVVVQKVDQVIMIMRISR